MECIRDVLEKKKCLFLLDLWTVNECFPVRFSEKGEQWPEKHTCVLVCLLFCSHVHVEMDGGDVMSGIDPLNTAPSRHNDDVIHQETPKRKTAAV